MSNEEKMNRLSNNLLLSDELSEVLANKLSSENIVKLLKEVEKYSKWRIIMFCKNSLNLRTQKDTLNAIRERGSFPSPYEEDK